MVLLNIDPILTGPFLAALDAMGHSDSVVIADAHFPAARLARERPVIDLPMASTPRVLRAVCSVIPPDDAPGLDLMAAPGDSLLDVQQELVAAASLEEDGYREVDRFDFYDLAAEAFLIVRTGETRIYGNALLRKGVVPHGGFDD
ncbi:MAG: RbsD/FucU domain-containing protein [Bowdeniella nasicola]|nr:RbsD/FucU domain-containing protein [Bowdeniella nasicola]